jgi:urease accessory protein
MYASLQAPDLPGTTAAPRRQRAHGRIVLDAAKMGSGSRIANLSESGPSRIRLPKAGGGHLEAVMMNTGGGVACGDLMEVEARARAGSDLVMTTPAAERCYKSDGAISEIHVRLDVEDGAHLAWLPQETILYDRARVSRTFTADVAESGTLTMFEAVMFGRAAMGETVRDGMLRDRWQVRRGGHLAFADALVLDGPITDLLARPAVAGGATAWASFVHVAPDAVSRLDEARDALSGAECACGASAWNGLLAVRFQAATIGTLRRTATAFLARFLGRPLPRVWHG